MQTTTLTLKKIQNEVIVLRPFADRFDEQVEKLEIILERFHQWRDSLSLKLHSWGYKIVMVIDLEKVTTEAVTEEIEQLETLLLSTQIEVKALEAKLPLEDKVHDFAVAMFYWMECVQNLAGYQSPSETARSLKKVNLTPLPPEIGKKMYHYLRSNQEKLERAHTTQGEVAVLLSKSSQIEPSARYLIARELRRAKAEVQQKLQELEELTTLKIAVMKEQHQVDEERMQFQVANMCGELARTRIHLEGEQEKNYENSRKVATLTSEINQLKGKVKNLEDELDDDGGCTIV